MNGLSILHLNTERTWRGGERQTLWLARELARRGHRSLIAARTGSPLAQRAREQGVPVIPVRPWSEVDLGTAWTLRRRLLRENIKILHAHTGRAVGLGGLSVCGTNVRFVATRRVAFPLKSGLYARWKYRRLDRVAAISSGVRRALQAGGVPNDKIRVIPSGIDPAGYPGRANRTRWRVERGLSLTDRLVVHAGALEPEKDQDTLLRAFALLVHAVPTARLLILGEGPLRAELERAALRAGVGERVQFLGQRSDVLEYTAAADLFVFSSREEGLGTALLDAMFLGVPTAATAGGGIPDLYGGPSAPELSPVGDAAALADNMARALRSSADADVRVERGLNRLRDFTVTAMTDGYETLYREVMTST